MDETWIGFFKVYGLLVAWQLLIIVLVGQMLYRRRSPAAIIAWLLAMLLIPYAAIPLYILVGWRKRKTAKRLSKHPFTLEPVHEAPLEETGNVDSILRSNSIPGPTRGNTLQLFFDGVDAYRELQRCIKEARHTIDISIYILDNDDASRSILAALEHKARAGVRVRLLLDPLGSLGLYLRQSKLAPLRQAGAEVSFFMPFARMPFRSYINLRNHRKIFLFDDKTALSGGMNISDDYMGSKSEAIRWRDLLFCIEGPAVYHFHALFCQDWSYTTGKKCDLLAEVPPGAGEVTLQVVPSGPDVIDDALYEALLLAIYRADRRIWIVTPYFAPDENLQKALIIAAHAGVDVKLITPRRADHTIIDIARSSYMRELCENGVEIVLTEGSMLHAKAILFDNHTVMLGSVNFDNRSLFLNYEIACFVYTDAVIEQTQLWIESMMEDAAHGMDPAGSVRLKLENLMRIFTPLL